MKIFLNPGHGGSDPGAVSKSGTKECVICKEICKILAEMLRLVWFDVEVYQQEKSFLEITQKENKSKAGLFVSVHCNSFSSAAANGVETLYYPTSSKGKEFATCVQKALIRATGLTNRGIKPRGDLHVLKSTVAPAVLVECAFLSNLKEESMLKNQPELFAAAIFEGIREYCAG